MKQKKYVKIDAPKFQFGEAFIDAFNKEKVSQFPADLVELSFLTENFSLIPKEQFSTDTAQNYLESCHAINPFDSIRFNPVSGKDFVVCFAYNEEIEFFFENKYPFVNIIHNASRNLGKLPAELTYKVQLIFEHNQFEIIAIGNQFEYYNCKNYESLLDVVYALKHFFLDRKSSSYEIVIFGDVNKEKISDSLKEHFSNTLRFIPETENYALIS